MRDEHLENVRRTAGRGLNAGSRMIDEGRLPDPAINTLIDVCQHILDELEAANNLKDEWNETD